MDGARRKQLREQYRQTRPEMGIFAFRCAALNRVYLGASQNLTATINSIGVQLNNNSFPTNRALMDEWNQYGQPGFSVEILEKLDYDKDNDAKTDYRDDLAILKEYWREQLTRGGAVVVNLRPKDR